MTVRPSVTIGGRLPLRFGIARRRSLDGTQTTRPGELDGFISTTLPPGRSGHGLFEK